MTTAHERIDALLVDEATGNLDDAGKAELEALLAEHRDIDRFAFERAAAAVFLAVGAAFDEQMPATLISKLAVDAEQELARRTE